MDKYESLSHSKWECKYHLVFIPKCRRKTLYGQLRSAIGARPYACSQITRFKCPREYQLVAALPKFNYGKVPKTGLRRQIGV